MSDNSKWALALGYAGVLPVAGLLVSAWSGAWQHQAVNSAIIYAALILSFLGGIHWGFATSGFASKKHFLVSVVPSLWAWMVFAAPDFFNSDEVGIIVIKLGFTTTSRFSTFGGSLGDNILNS